MTDSSVEAVARALHKHEWDGQPVPDNFATDREYWLSAARAAIAALPSPEREPMREALEALRRDSDRATPGPWTYEEDQEGSSMGWIGHVIPAGRGKVFRSLFEVEGDSWQQAINAEFAAACVNFVRAALAPPTAQSPSHEASHE